MSQTPIREALSILEHERFVESAPKKGYRIKVQDVQEIEDLYDVRIAIEVLAAENAASSLSQANHDRLVDVLDKFPNLITIGEKAQILELEQRVHLIIMEATGNQRLSEIGRDILDRIWMVQKIVLFSSEHWIESYQQHVEIFNTLKDGDSDRAAALMKKHLCWGKELVLTRLKDEDDFMSSIISGFPQVHKNLDNQ
jgi:DNA-binding GntR family transcriptional regulator